MKKTISVLICIAILLSSFCFSVSAQSSLRYTVDFKPEGIYCQGADRPRITGWAFDASGATVRCYYRIDGGNEIQVDPVNRNDVMNAFPDECSQLDCGYNQFISVDNLSIGEHTFLFYAKCSANETVLCETTFTVAGINSDCNSIPSGVFNVEDTDSLAVVGWAFNFSGEETDCWYQIDEQSKVIMNRTERSDVQAVFNCTQLDCGFYYHIPISEFTVGKHKLTLIATSGSFEKVIASSEVEIKTASENFKHCADFFPKGTYPWKTTDEIHLGGWAFNVNGYETRCYYQIDNGDLTMLTPDIRNDVMTAFPDICTQPDNGYQSDISIENLGKGVHTYRVIAKCSKVSEVLQEFTFTVIGSEGNLISHSEYIPDREYNLDSESVVIVGGWGYNTSDEGTKFYGKFDNGSEFYPKPSIRNDVFESEAECYRNDCGYNQPVYLGNLSHGVHSFTVIMVSNEKTAIVETSTFSVIKPQYTVSFNANGGQNVPDSMTKKFGKNLVFPDTKPVREYYVFDGWNTSPDGNGEAVSDSYKANSSTVLYAMWKHEEFETKSDSALSLDAKEKLVYGEALNGDVDTIKSSFANKSVTVSDTTVVTGTRISISDSDGIYDTIQAVILGDINSDGRIDGMDAVLASCIKNGMLNINDIGKASYSAADCLRDSSIDSGDVEKLINTGIMLDTVEQNSVQPRGYYDTDFTVKSGEAAENSVIFNGKAVDAQILSTPSETSITLNASCEDFNFFGIKYSSDAYSKGVLSFKQDDKSYNEVFFLEPGENKSFHSYIDGVFENVKGNKLVSLNIIPLSKEAFSFNIFGVSVFNREIPDTVTYIENESIKIGLNMEWGGSLSYYEDLDSNVQAVADNGIIRIDSNASQRFNTESLNNSVNLVNCHDTGRLVQQSYYGTTNYDMGFFNGQYVAYNPVQGGNMYNESSKIVDLRVGDNTIYVKCRPLDWAKSKEYITDSYMEATYTLQNDTLKTECRFVDFSGYDSRDTTQEFPAFYGAATMDNFVYYGGEQQWTDGELSTLDKLDEYLYAQYPATYPTEQWGALTGEFDDSFSIGLYVPDSEYMLSGVYESIAAQTENPDISNPTSYLAGGKKILFQSYDPIEYDFYITTGTVDYIRNNFKAIATAS